MSAQESHVDSTSYFPGGSGERTYSARDETKLSMVRITSLGVEFVYLLEWMADFSREQYMPLHGEHNFLTLLGTVDRYLMANRVSNLVIFVRTEDYEGVNDKQLSTLRPWNTLLCYHSLASYAHFA